MTYTAIPPRSRISSSAGKDTGLPTFTTSLQGLAPGAYPYAGSKPRPQTAVAWLGSLGGGDEDAAEGEGGAAAWLGHGEAPSADAVGRIGENGTSLADEPTPHGESVQTHSSGLWNSIRSQEVLSRGMQSPAESSLSASDYLGHGGSAFGTERWVASVGSGTSSPDGRMGQVTASISPAHELGGVSERVTNFPLFAHHHPHHQPAFSTPASPIDHNDRNNQTCYVQHPDRQSHTRSDSFFSDPGPDDEAMNGLIAGPFVPTSFSQLLPLRIASGSEAVSTIDMQQGGGSMRGEVGVPFSPASAFLSSFSDTHSMGDRDDLGVGSSSHQGKRNFPSGHPGIPVVSALSISDPNDGVNPSTISPPMKDMRHPRRPSAPDAAGSVVLGYTLGKVLGRGGFSTVRLATHNLTGKQYACRIIKRDDLSDISGSAENFEKEIELWKALPKHPNILPLLEMYRDPRGWATYLVSPYMPGGSLLDVLQKEKGSEKVARKWFPGIVAAVRALHEGYEGFEEGGMLHGDLKLDNFLVGLQGEVCVCDFGLARKIGKARDKNGSAAAPDDERRGRWSRTNSRAPTPQPSLSRSRTRPQLISPFASTSATMPASFQIPTIQSAGMKRPESRDSNPIHHHMPHPRRHGQGQHDGHLTPVNAFPSASLPYAPPELLRAPPAGLSLAQDMWGLGVILHALLTSRLPFVDTFDPRLQMKIIKGDWIMPEGLGREWQECLVSLLDGNRDTRWDIARLAESDAVVGWSEVKARSKSRSRSRSRRPDFAERQRSSSRPRNEDRHKTATPPAHAFNAHLTQLTSPPYRTASLHDIHGAEHLDRVPEDGERVEFHRDTSAAGNSRSRSSGRGEGSGIFLLDIVDAGMGSVPGPRSPSQPQREFLGGSQSRSRSRPRPA